jgi:predicted DNA-binding protein
MPNQTRQINLRVTTELYDRITKESGRRGATKAGWIKML